MRKDNLGNRMKRYEHVNRNSLMRRSPVIIRLDGKAFHSFTKGLNRPFDEILIRTMQETAKYLCENIQGCKIAYTQSDEITLLLTDYEKIGTQGWFEYNIQKMVSISASMATLAFNNSFRKQVEFIQKMSTINTLLSEEDKKYIQTLERKLNTALFDSRVFSIPKDEVNNCFVWRQQDATRNSIQMVGQANFSHKELDKKSCDNIQEMLFTERNINWNDSCTPHRRGTCIVKEQYLKETNGESVTRTRWAVDKNIPIFSSDKNYIEQYVFTEDDKQFNLIDINDMRNLTEEESDIFQKALLKMSKPTGVKLF